MTQANSPAGTQPSTALASARPTRGRPRLDAETSARILDLALSQPQCGQDSLARQLRGAGVWVSASGVRQVLERHGLQTRAQRLARIEAVTRSAGRRVETSGLTMDGQAPAPDADSQMRAASSGPRPVDASAHRGSHILAVAARLIRERGFDAISLRDIAETAGVPSGSLYYHFPTKELLFTSVYEEGIRRLRASVEAALERANDPWKRLEQACTAHLANLCGGDDFTAVSIPTRIPVLTPPANEAVVALNDGYEQIFRDLVDALRVRHGVSKTLLRLQLLGALNWTSVWYRQGGADTGQIARHLVRVLRTGTQVTVKRGVTAG